MSKLISILLRPIHFGLALVLVSLLAAPKLGAAAQSGDYRLVQGMNESAFGVAGRRILSIS